MQAQSETEVIIEYKHASGAPAKEPSYSMTQALQMLGESDEMQLLVANAREQRRKVVVEVFHGRDGYPLLIHTSAVSKK